MGRHGEAKKNYPALFPLLAREEPELFECFRGINAGLCGYIAERLNKEISDVGIADLVGPNRRVHPDLAAYFKERYKTDTRKSQISSLNRLLEQELSYLGSQTVITAEMARLNLVDPDKLEPFLREIWLALPRKRGAIPHLLHRLPTDEIIALRASLPLVEPGNDVFAALLEVVEQFDIKDARTLVVTKARWVRIAIYKRVSYEDRYDALRFIRAVRYKLNLKVRTGYYAVNFEDLPPAILEAILVYEERGPKGLGDYDELKYLAERDEDVPLEPHKPATIESYILQFAAGVRKLKLPKHATLQTMLALETEDVEENGVVVGKRTFSPLIEELRKMEREKVNPGHKIAGKDSASFISFMTGFTAICRFNGIFHQIKELSKTVKRRPDHDTLADERFLMKTVMSVDWVDRGVENSLKTFYDSIKNQRFLSDERALAVCCGLPQLMTLRFLGYRQECIRKGREGKNVILGGDGSVTFHFDRHEIKNEVLIHQHFPPGEIVGMPELVELLKVLRAYKGGFLKVFERRYPEHYKANVGKSFYVMPAKDADGRLLVQGFPAAPEDLHWRSVREIEKASRSLFYDWFQTAVKLLLDTSILQGHEWFFFPHFLRSLCCHWMRDDLGWDWDRVEEAMGDVKRTLMRSYYSKGLRRQTANSFIQESKRRLAEREARERAADSVPLNAFQAVNQTLVITSEENKELRDERKILSVENTTLRDENDILRERLTSLSQENIALRELISSSGPSVGLSAENFGGDEPGSRDRAVLAG